MSLLAPEKLTALTLNIHKGRSILGSRPILNELRDLIRKVGADLVFLQEVVGQGQDLSAQYEFLADTIWKHYAYAKNAVSENSHHGNAILSKFPILSETTLDLSIPGFEPRSILTCQIETPASTVHALCTHLGLRRAERKQQIEKMDAYLAPLLKLEEPFILAGDFNDWRANEMTYFERKIGLTESHKTLHQNYARTYPSFLPFLRLDRIYFHGFSVVSAEALRLKDFSHLSDHLGLRATFHLKDGSAFVL